MGDFSSATVLVTVVCAGTFAFSQIHWSMLCSVITHSPLLCSDACVCPRRRCCFQPCCAPVQHNSIKQRMGHVLQPVSLRNNNSSLSSRLKAGCSWVALRQLRWLKDCVQQHAACCRSACQAVCAEQAAHYSSSIPICQSYVCYKHSLVHSLIRTMKAPSDLPCMHVALSCRDSTERPGTRR